MGIVKRTWGGFTNWLRPKQGGNVYAVLKDPSIPLPFGNGKDRIDALNIAPIAASVRLLCDMLAQLPLKVHRDDGSGNTAPTDHPMMELLRRPAPEFTRYRFIERIVRDLCLWGNFYALKVRDVRGRVIQLRPLDAWAVEVGQLDDYSLTYKAAGVEMDGRRLFTAEDVLHLRYQCTDGITGEPPVMSCLSAATVWSSASHHLQRIHEAHKTINGVFTLGPTVTSQTALKDSIKELEKSAAEKSIIGSLVLENGATYTPFKAHEEAQQCRQSISDAAAEIAQAFRIPPHELGMVDRNTSWGSGIEQLSMVFVSRTITPWANLIEEDLTAQLLDEKERETTFFRFNTAGLLRSDLLTRYQAYAIGIQNRWLNPNGVLKKEDEPPRPDGEGDRYISPLNMRLEGEEEGERGAKDEQHAHKGALGTSKRFAGANQKRRTAKRQRHC